MRVASLAHGVAGRQDRPRCGRREQALAGLGDRSPAVRAGRDACVHLPGRAHRGERARAGRVGRLRRLHRVRRLQRREHRQGVRRARRAGRRPRSHGPLDRVRPGPRPGGALHRHGSRRLPPGARHQRVLAGRHDAARRAADGGARRRCDRHDDVPGRRARHPGLQRHGRRQGRARRVHAVPGGRPRPEEHPGQRDQRRARAHAGCARHRGIQPDGGRDRRARRAEARDRGRRRRPGRLCTCSRRWPPA